MTEDKDTIASARAEIARMNAARKFPINTCPASRHTAMMAEALSRHGAYSMLQDEPRHCAESIAATVKALWEARAALRSAGYEWKDGAWVLKGGAE